MKKLKKVAVFLLIVIFNTIFFYNQSSYAVYAENINCINVGDNTYYVVKKASKTKTGKLVLIRCNSTKGKIKISGEVTYKKQKYKVIGISNNYDDFYIDEYVFNPTVKEVILPDTLTFLGDSVFYNCTNLKQIDIPKTVKSIGYAAFWGSGLKEVTIPDGVKSIGNSAFKYCTELVKAVIPGSVKTIDNLAFINCSSLKSVELSEGIESIGRMAFTNCSELESIVLPNSIKKLDEAVFYGNLNLKTVKLPDKITHISKMLFLMSGLEEINLPDSIETIGSNAFSSSKVSFTALPKNLKSIESDAFSLCTNLTDLTIPDEVEYIGDKAFWGCYNLKHITIPPSVKIIGKDAFLGCALGSGADGISGITGKQGSLAEQIAKEMNITFNAR